MKPLFVTPFDIKTKLCTGPSQEVPIQDGISVPQMFGQPDSATKNTMIFNQPNGQALCVSWIRFSV